MRGQTAESLGRFVKSGDVGNSERGGGSMCIEWQVTILLKNKEYNSLNNFVVSNFI